MKYELKNTFNKPNYLKPLMRLRFGQVAYAVTKAKSPYFSYRFAAAVHRITGVHNTLREARLAFMRLRYMSPCYKMRMTMPSMMHMPSMS